MTHQVRQLVGEGPISRYENIDRLAQYIEAGWGDYFDPAPLGRTDCFQFGTRTIPFYREAAKFIQDTVRSPERVADLGAATGRLVFELQKTYQKSEFLVCEPTHHLLEFGKAMLSGNGIARFLPVSETSSAKVKFVEAPKSLQRVAKEVHDIGRMDFFEGFAEDVQRPHGYFDLVVCLNVICRSPDPRRLVRHCADLSREYLCISSPFEWEKDQAPERERSYGIGDCVPEGMTLLKTSVVNYELRINDHYVVAYRSEIALMRKDPAVAKKKARA